MTVRPGRPRMFVVFMESPVLPFSLPFLNSPISLILLMLESLSSGRLYIPSIPLFSNINLAFFGLFNCPFSSFELIPSSKCWEECCLLCTLCFPPFFPFYWSESWFGFSYSAVYAWQSCCLPSSSPVDESFGFWLTPSSKRCLLWF